MGLDHGLILNFLVAVYIEVFECLDLDIDGLAGVGP